MKNRISIAESDLKYGVDEYLQYGKNAGRWLFFRLNAGDFIIQQGNSRRRIKGVPIGTAPIVSADNFRPFSYVRRSLRAITNSTRPPAILKSAT